MVFVYILAKFGNSFFPCDSNSSVTVEISSNEIISFRFFAATVGMQMQVWFAPGHTQDFSPFTLHRTYTGQYDDTVSIDWSSDSRYILMNGC